MPIHVRCTCGVRLRFPDGTEGKYAQCKKCGAKVLIEPEDVSETPNTANPRQGASAAGAHAPSSEEDLILSARGIASDTGLRAEKNRKTAANFWVDVGQSFVFFLRLDNLASFVLVVVMNLLIAVSGYGMIWGLFGGLVLRGLLAAFYLNVIVEVARGEDKLPAFSLTDFWDDVVRPGLLFLVSMLLVMVPAVVAYVWAPSTSDFGLPWILGVVGLFCWPATVLMVAIGDGFRSLRPDLVLRTILSAFAPYLAIWIMLLLAAAPTYLPELLTWGASDELPAAAERGPGLILTQALAARAASAYTMIVSMRLIGLYYRHFKKRFPWRAE
ncbi:MAG TPA: hypothetical protein VMZ31_02020 [Phycisphaerae bacterium]|nr:hypothetical protein [Phycisphaerae bacterium]